MQQPLSAKPPSPSSPGNWLALLGPGVITAALVFGPSKVTIATKMGAEYGYSLFWVVVVAIFFMAVFTGMSGRIGLATSTSFLSLIKAKWGKPWAIAAGTGIFLVCSSFQAGNSIGIGIALGEMFHTSTVPWIVGFNLAGVCLLFFRSFYKTLEKLMILLVLIMLAAFVFTLVLSKPSPGSLAGGLIPAVPAGATPLMIAFVASCFSIVGACYQSYLVQEKRRVSPNMKQTSSNSLPGILILGVMSAVVLVCAAVVLHPQHVVVSSGSDMAKALEPLFGSYSAAFFLTGLFGAAFSSLVGNASLGGTLMGDALGYGHNFGSAATRLLIALIMIIGAFVAIVYGTLPIQLMVFAQSVTVFVVPFVGFALYTIASDAETMGELKNKVWQRWAGALGLALLAALALQNARTLFF